MERIREILQHSQNQLILRKVSRSMTSLQRVLPVIIVLGFCSTSLFAQSGSRALPSVQSFAPAPAAYSSPAPSFAAPSYSAPSSYATPIYAAPSYSAPAPVSYATSPSYGMYSSPAPAVSYSSPSNVIYSAPPVSYSAAPSYQVYMPQTQYYSSPIYSSCPASCSGY